MRGTDIVFIVIAIAAIAAAVATAVGATRKIRQAQECAATARDRADLLEAQVQVLDAYRTATKMEDPSTLTRELLGLRALVQQSLDVLVPPPSPEPRLDAPIRHMTPLIQPRKTGTTRQPHTPAEVLAEELRTLLRHLGRNGGDSRAPFAGRDPQHLRNLLREDSDRLADALAAYRFATAVTPTGT